VHERRRKQERGCVVISGMKKVLSERIAPSVAQEAASGSIAINRREQVC